MQGGASNPDKEAARVHMVETKCGIGEISKAHQAALPSDPYAGPVEGLQDLHPPPSGRPPMIAPPPPASDPTVHPLNFHRSLCEVSRGTAQTADGWLTDHLKSINVKPTEEVPDPLYGIREFAISFASGALPVSQEVYTLLAGAKLVALAKPDSDKPRPVGVTGVLHRLGMGALLRDYADILATYFGDQKEFGTGIPGVTQILSWGFKLAAEKHPAGVMFWADISNGFNAMERESIAQGLADMPDELQWLRRSFHKFYANDVTLYFSRAGEVHEIVSMIGSMQGDPASGIWFNAGLMRAFNKLRAEFPEVFLAKYFDDVNGFILPSADGTTPLCLLSEERALSFPGAYAPADGPQPESVPMARAVCARWKYIAKTMCGLDIKKKWGVASVDTALDQADYGDVQTGGLPVVDGLVVAGVPVGPEEFVRSSILKKVTESVGGSYSAISTLPKVQIQNLLARMCGGNVRVHNLWQTVLPSLCLDAQNLTDAMTDSAVVAILGVDPADFDGLAKEQTYHPMRNGGLGFRRAADTKNSTFIGGFCTSTLGKYNVCSVMPFLRGDVAKPEFSDLPSLIEVTRIWREICTSLKRIWTLARAAVAGVIRPPSEDPAMSNPETFPKQLAEQEARFEQKFKSQAIKGKTPEQAEATWDSLTDRIYDRCDEENDSNRRDWSNFKKAQFDHPEDHPSVLTAWAAQGGEKFQKILSRTNDMLRFLNFFASIGAGPNGLRNQALFRAQLNPLSSVPLTILPNTHLRKFSNAKFQWILCNRVHAMQPSVVSIKDARCICNRGPIIGADNGRHCRSCSKTDTSTYFHDGVRDELNLFCRAAGLPSRIETPGLLPDERDLRPADIDVPDFTIDGIVHTRHAIDFTGPIVESGWQSLSHAARLERASVVGVKAKKSVLDKRNNRGSVASQEIRGNAYTMQERCRRNQINFWPVAIETDGAMSPSFLEFFNHVCNVSNELTGQNRSTFKSYWWKRICCRVHHLNATCALMSTAKIRRRVLRVPAFPESELQLHQIQTDLPDSVSNRESYRDRQRTRRAISRRNSRPRAR